jgi:hypothetical protein
MAVVVSPAGDRGCTEARVAPLALLFAASRDRLRAVEDFVDRAACLEGGAEGGL